MTGDELLILNRVAHLTPRQLADHPAARTLFVRVASGRLKRDLASQLGASAPALHDRVMGLEIADELDGGRDLRLRLEEQTKDLPPATQSEARARLAELERSGLLRSPWKPDTPLRDHPLLGATMARAEVHAIAALARLDEDSTEALVETARSAYAIDAPMLQRLVRLRKLHEDAAQRVAHFATLHHFVDGRYALIEALEKKEETAPRFLARKDPAAWATTLRTAGEEPPPGRSLEEWARDIARRYAALFPTDAMLSRLTVDGRELGNQLKTASPAELRRIANRYPGLDVRSLLFKGGSKAGERASWVADRVALLDRMREFNKDAELLALDYSPGSEDLANIQSGGLPPAERAMAIDAFRVYQRVLWIAGDPDTARAVLEGGFHSAAAIVRAGARRFAGAVDLPEEQARRVYDRARDIAVNSTAAVGALLEAPPALRGAEVRALDPHDVLHRGEGKGTCARCRSMLGLPAYLADLLQLVEERVLEPIYGEQPDHPRSLRMRRPDIFTTPLGCRAQAEQVPTLDVVNGLLEKAAGPAVKVPGLAAERLERMLGVLHSSRLEVATTLGVSPTWAQALRLSPAEAATLVRPKLDAEVLDDAFGAAVRAGSDGIVAPLDAETARVALGLAPGELDALAATQFVTGDGGEIAVRDGRLAGATLAALDRLQRLARLARRLPWSIGELDQALSSLGITSLGADDVAALVRLRDLDARLGLGLEETCAIAGKIGRGALFDRLFNLPAFVQSGGEWPREGRFVHPALRADKTASSPDLPRLLAGLRIGDGELVALIHGLAFWLNCDPEAEDEEDRGFAVTRANLALLHRHARLVRHLGCSAPELFQIMKLAGITNGAVTSLGDVEAILGLHGWLKTAGFTVDELAFATGRRVLRPERLPRAPELAAAIDRELDEQYPPPEHDAVARMLQATVPRPIAETAARLLGARLGQPADKIAALAALAGADLGTNDAPALEAAIAAVLPLTVLLRHPAFDAAAVRFLADHGAALGVDFGALDVAAARRLVTYAGWIDDGAAAEDVHAMMSGNPDPARLSRVLDCEPGLAAELRARLALPEVPGDALGMLVRAADLAQRLGAGADTLVRAASTTDEDMARAADGLVGALRARHADEQRFREDLAPVEDALREARRDALLRALRRGGDPAHADPAGHFLIDVGSAGTARASRLDLAVDAVRRYVERCRAGREEDVPRGVIGDGDWPWRRSHAGWVARRKLFLFPEGELAPPARVDRTPLFAAFEAELARGEVTPDQVLAAVGRYLRGLEELAAVSLAGAYHELAGDPERDRLHLFGVSGGKLYHRAIDNAWAAGRGGAVRGRIAWPWAPIDLGGAPRRVAPISHQGRPHLFWVEYKTRPRHEMKGGAPTLVGYRHEMVVKHSALQLDGAWAPPRDLALGEGAIIDDPLGEKDVPRFDTMPHDAAVDGYGPRGPGWDDLSIDLDALSGALVLTGKNNSETMYRVVDLARREARAWPPTFWGYQPSLPASVQLLCARGSTRKLYAGRPPTLLGTRDGATALLLDEGRIDALRAEAGDRVRKDGLYAREILTFEAGDDLLGVRGSFTDAILDHRGDMLLVQGAVADDGAHRITRLGTTLAGALAARVFSDGVLGVYDQPFVDGLAESAIDVSTAPAADVRVPEGAIDWRGPSGVYLRELYLHIPLHAAARLSAAGLNEAAAGWLARAQLPERDLRDALRDAGALEAYRRAPLDPSAVFAVRQQAPRAHLRLRTVANLLAWSDRLLAEGSADARSQARSLHLQAGDLLGAAPPQPTCATGAAGAGDAASLSSETGEILALLENLESLFCSRALAGGRKEVETASVLRPLMEPLRLAVKGARLTAFGGAVPEEPDGDDTAAFGWSILRGLLGAFTPVADEPLRRELAARIC